MFCVHKLDVLKFFYYLRQGESKMQVLGSAKLIVGIDEKRCWKAMCHLGLSEYEARVYTSLVKGGACDGRKLSLMCGVPRTKVYETLKKLMERGLVFELPEYPRKFAPTSPAEAFEAGLSYLKEEASSRKILLREYFEAVSLLEENYKKTQLTITPSKEEVWVLRVRREILSKMREMLSRAKKSVIVITTENGFILFYKTAGKLLDKLNESGVDVQLIAPINSHSRRLARELRYVCDVKNVDIDFPFLFLSIDNREFLLAELKPDDFDVDSGNDMGVLCQNPDILHLISLLLPKPIMEAFRAETLKYERQRNDSEINMNHDQYHQSKVEL
jgi:sugar-specific transcriptional regulator TrmB